FEGANAIFTTRIFAKRRGFLSCRSCDSAQSNHQSCQRSRRSPRSFLRAQASWFARASHYRRGISRPLAVRTEIDDGARAEVRRAFRRARDFALLLHGRSLGIEREPTLAGAYADSRTDRICAVV